MNRARQEAILYLRAPADAPWKWVENGAAVAWSDGTTIAFREEISQILQWLAPTGLPSFGAIVFLLAATRGKIAAFEESRNQARAQIQDSISELQKVITLPSELRSGIKARCVLAEAVFEGATAERPFQGDWIIQGMSEPMTDAELRNTERAASGSFIRQLHIVAAGLKRHTPESLDLRIKTGLDALPKDGAAETPLWERARSLIDELARDSELGVVGRAAKDLMAAVRLPRRLASHDELALSGVADLSNRGPLDRLLLSELAHDDLTLAVRVALNEALYLRREPPAREPPGALAILIDSGVRLWGTPRALATAAALALIARDQHHAQLKTWRASGKSLQPIDLLSKKGLTEHLATLETEPHPAKALGKFSEETASLPEAQCVLLTHADTIADPDFRRALSEAPNIAFVATVNRNGSFEMHATPLARRTPICQADLDLAAIFAEKSAIPLIDKKADRSAPLIYGVRPLPFLLPLPGRIDFWTRTEDGFTYIVLNDRRLSRFTNRSRGGNDLAYSLPAGKTLWMDVHEGSVHLVKAGSQERPARLVSVPIDGGFPRIADLVSGSDVHAVVRDGSTLLVVRTHDIRAYALSDVRMLGRTVNPFQWVLGRFFRDEKRIYFAAWDGASVRLEPVSLPNEIDAGSVALIFDRAGLEGPWLLLKNFHVISTATGEPLHIPGIALRAWPLLSASVSKDGNSILAIGEQDTVLILLDTEGGPRTITGVSPLNFDPPPSAPTWNVYNAIDAIGRTEDGLALRGRNQRQPWRKLVLDHKGALQIVGASPTDVQSIAKVSISTKAMPDGCPARIAEWPNGAKAFLDTRGILTLKSADATRPEVSILLADNEVAAWTSDGFRSGPAFFFDVAIDANPGAIFQRIIDFF